MHPSDADLEWGLRKTRGKNVALIHGGVTTWPGKNWPVYRMAKIVDALKQMGYFTIAVGSGDSPDCGCDDTIAGRSTPQQFYALATHAKLFVGLDSMPQHVASAANTPSVVLFGPTNPKAIVRPTPSIIAVQADVNLVPCVGEHGRRKKVVTQSPCSAECIQAITVEMVLSAIKTLQARFPK